MKESIRTRSAIALLSLLWMFVAPLHAAEESSEDASKSAASKLAGLLENYETFEASFIQIVVNENGSQVQETRGQLRAKRPGLFYWETTAPLSQYIVSNGETVEVFDPDLEQVTVHKLDSKVSTTPALLLSGEVDNLDATYKVSARTIGDTTHEFTLEPRNPDSLFVSLMLTFSGDELHEMRMRDSLGQLSVLSFNDIQVNDGVDDAAFTLDYPDDVDVIRDDA